MYHFVILAIFGLGYCEETLTWKDCADAVAQASVSGYTQQSVGNVCQQANYTECVYSPACAWFDGAYCADGDYILTADQENWSDDLFNTVCTKPCYAGFYAPTLCLAVDGVPCGPLLAKFQMSGIFSFEEDEPEEDADTGLNFTALLEFGDSFCSPCIAGIFNVTDIGFPLCIQTDNGDSCFTSILTALPIVQTFDQGPEAMLPYFNSPDLCNECVSGSGLLAELSEFLCNPDPNYKCGLMVQANMDDVPAFCAATPECQATAVCLIVNGTECWEPLAVIEANGWDFEDVSTLNVTFFRWACLDQGVGGCIKALPGFEEEDFNALCLHIDGTFCAPVGYEAKKYTDAWVGMDQQTVVATYMNDPIVCNDCMTAYKAYLNETEAALYSLVCPATSPTAQSASSPTEAASSSTSLKLSGLLSIVYAIAMFVY